MEEQAPPAQLYKGIDITYNETANRWEFELDGKERFASTLKLAKEAIDKPRPKDKKPFTPFKAYKLDRWDDTKHVVTVTSQAETPSYREHNDFWVKHESKSRFTNRGSREKVSAPELILITPENDAILAAIKGKRKEREALEKQIEALQLKLTHPKAVS